MKNQSPPTVLRIFSLFLYQTAALFNAQKIRPIWRASDKKSQKITKNLSPPTVLRIFSQFLYQTAVFFSAQKIRPIWRASETCYGFWQNNRLD